LIGDENNFDMEITRRPEDVSRDLSTGLEVLYFYTKGSKTG
jgi:hypothetical protein